MDLCNKENHCEFCEKAFCCYGCRFKHESNIHKKHQSDISRKASIRYTAFKKKNSLPKILESIELNNFDNQILKDNRKINSIFVYKDTSNTQLEDKTKEEKTSTELLTDEKITQRKKRILRIISSEEPFYVTVNGDDKLAHFLGFSKYQRKNIPENAENIENIPPNNIDNNKTNAGNTPPRAISLILEKSRTTNSVKKAESLDDNSSIYCACSENWTKSDNPKWISALSEIGDSSKNIVGENSENSSIYFACSEFLSKELSATKCNNRTDFFEGFETFQKSSKMASTKLDMSISSAQEALESEGNLKTEYISCTGKDYSTTNEDRNSKNGNTINDYSTQSTISLNQSELSIILDECSSIRIEAADRFTETRREYLSDWVRACATQTSIGFEKEDKDSSNEVLPSDDHVEVISETTVSANEVSGILEKRDNTFWNSFSNSLQRAYNSTKEICNSLGRRNKSKREHDDIEGPEPKRKKLSILCRPPIRDNPRVIFRQDGDIRRPVIAYDRGTQTDNFLFEAEF